MMSFDDIKSALILSSSVAATVDNPLPTYILVSYVEKQNIRSFVYCLSIITLSSHMTVIFLVNISFHLFHGKTKMS
jgi:hypothetical protein